MIRKKINILVMMLLAFSYISAQETYKFSGGSGTKQDPYQISSIKDLNELNKMTNDDTGNTSKTDGKYYLLTNDIKEPFTGMIGTEANFNGNFDGGNHCINLSINRTWDKYPSGLFGTATRGSIKNLSVEGSVNIMCGAAIVGNPSGGEILENLVNFANVTAKSTSQLAGVGGVIGNIVSRASDNVGVTVKNCANYGTITCYGGAVGGVIGYSGQQIGNTIENIANYGHIVGKASYGEWGKEIRVAGVIGNPLYKDKVDKILNFGTTADLSIVGVIGNSNPTTIKNIFYDCQLCPSNNGIETQKLTTTKAIGLTMKDILSESNWLLEDGMYPRPRMNGIEKSQRAILFATPILLAEGDDIKNITTDFKVTIKNKVTWTCKNKKVSINSQGEVKSLKEGEETLIATLGNYKREIVINIKKVSGINNIENNKNIKQDVWYNLNGVRIQKPNNKGIYIHNGQKTIVK